jgi:hypothetical protein
MPNGPINVLGRDNEPNPIGGGKPQLPPSVPPGSNPDASGDGTATHSVYAKPNREARRPRRLVKAVRTSGLEAEVKRFAVRLRREYEAEITRDARGFKKRVVTIVRRNLPPFAGRPSEEAITRAISLRKQGCEWKAIYPQCIPRHASLPPAVRRQAESNLRAACRKRRKREVHRQAGS